MTTGFAYPWHGYGSPYARACRAVAIGTEEPDNVGFIPAVVAAYGAYKGYKESKDAAAGAGSSAQVARLREKVAKLKSQQTSGTSFLTSPAFLIGAVAVGGVVLYMATRRGRRR